MKQHTISEPSNWSVSVQQALRPINKKFLYNKYVDSLPILRNYKVLEFGSGVGAMAELLARKVDIGELTCVDVSDRYISKARKNLREYKNTSFHHGRLASLTIDENHYDAINVHQVLHLVIKENRQDLVEEMFRLLKNGGKVYLREFIDEENGITGQQINKLFLKAGFRVVRSEETRTRFKRGIITASYCKLSTILFFLS